MAKAPAATKPAAPAAPEPKKTQQEMVAEAMNEVGESPKDIVAWIEAKYSKTIAASTVSMYKGKIKGTSGTRKTRGVDGGNPAPTLEQMKEVRVFAEKFGGIVALAVIVREVADFMGDIERIQELFNEVEEVAELEEGHESNG